MWGHGLARRGLGDRLSSHMGKICSMYKINKLSTFGGKSSTAMTTPYQKHATKSERASPRNCLSGHKLRGIIKKD